MKFIYSFLLFLIVSTIHSQNIQSPSKALTLNFTLSENGKPNYTVTYKNKPIILESFLGLKLKTGIDLSSHFKVEDSKTSTFNETWKPVLGEQATISNHYNELKVSLSQTKANVKMNIIFRVFDDGVAFRYDFPKQKNLNYFIISDEVSEFNLAGNHKVFWIPGDFDSNE